MELTATRTALAAPAEVRVSTTVVGWEAPDSIFSVKALVVPETNSTGRSTSPKSKADAGVNDSATVVNVEGDCAICQALAGSVLKVGGDPCVVKMTLAAA